ncbi:HAD family phosphatase [Sulfitobacter sp. LCG007]
MPALLFDLDGTMLDTDAIHRQVFVDMLGPRGIEVTEDFYRDHIHGRLNADFFAEWLPDEPDPIRLSDEKEAEFRRRLPRPYPAMPGVVALVERATEAGWPMAVVTNAMRPNAEAMLEAIGLRAHFDLLVIGEECPRGKPDPYPYVHAMEQLGVTPQTAIAFEDSPSGIRAAVGSGARTVAVRSALTREAALAEGAHASIQDFTDPALEDELRRLKGVPT